MLFLTMFKRVALWLFYSCLAEIVFALMVLGMVFIVTFIPHFTAPLCILWIAIVSVLYIKYGKS